MGSAKDIKIGDVFGRLTILEVGLWVQRKSDKRSAVLCMCECGKTTTIRACDLISGGTKSCGCMQGGAGHKMYNTSEYSTWRTMIQRCHNPKAASYKGYGGRGIVVCDRWRYSFANFIADMGGKPGKHYTLDRINNDLGYDPSNCRWVTVKTNNRNKRNTINITLGNTTKSLSDWADDLGLVYDTLVGRYKKGWEPRKILSTNMYGNNTRKNKHAKYNAAVLELIGKEDVNGL